MTDTQFEGLDDYPWSQDRAHIVAQRALVPGERLLCGSHISKFETIGTLVKGFESAVLISDQRVLVVAGKFIGSPKIAKTYQLTELDSSGCGPLYGVGPTWEAHFKLVNGPMALMFMPSPVAAEAFTARLQDAAARALAAKHEPPPHQSTPSELAHLDRLHAVLDDLRPLATVGMIGQPFGDGSGLDRAKKVIFARLDSIQDVRECGGSMAVELIIDIHDDKTSEELNRVMGATEEAMRTFSAPRPVWEAAVQLTGGAKVFLEQFPGGPGNMWDLWQRDDDVAVEFLAWHSVARLRMATAGLMPEVTRPN